MRAPAARRSSTACSGCSGSVAYAVPFGLAAAGAVLVLRPVLPAWRPFRAAAVCLLAALTLSYAAGTLGLGSGPPRGRTWDPVNFEHRGGALGEAINAGTARTVGDVGTHIFALFLLTTGVLLLTGASIAGVVRTTGTSVADTTRVIRRSAAPVLGARARARRGRRAAAFAVSARARGRRADRPARRAPADARRRRSLSRPVRRRGPARRAAGSRRAFQRRRA